MKARVYCSCSLAVLLATHLDAALTISTDFESGSALVLAVNEETQTIRIMPAGDPDRGWPSWWYLRVDGVTHGKPLTLEVQASNARLPAHRAKGERILDPAWTLP